MLGEPLPGPVDRVVAGVATPLVGLADLEMLVQKLLLSVPALAPAPPPRPVPTEIETHGETVPRRLLQSGMPTPVPRWCVLHVADRATKLVGATFG